MSLGKLWLYVGARGGWRDVGAAGCLALDDAADGTSYYAFSAGVTTFELRVVGWFS